MERKNKEWEMERQKGNRGGETKKGKLGRKRIRGSEEEKRKKRIWRRERNKGK